ncbi:GNAT family N-acetyltransferase [Jatrophihabitans telluris]|uniref:GNAT family N-acetyltransferase n=1 Tax=Jatrophihabitans telluris TaxID=2038343 RepID=A0ABY4R1M8_9ACTN|nr:GNAT family N-acetyltransferase [Jatrophihabitans telluris]UQX89377.1 GNAT family N-acetyltransferase [Jatrophihabitans telluris]
MIIAKLSESDAGEVLTLQRAAYVTEAQLHSDLWLPALTQTLDQLRAELADEHTFGLKAVDHGRFVGTVRARADGPVLRIGRLAVAPDLQRRGIGTTLLIAIENAAPRGIERFELFTGHRSVANLRLYERHGYTETRRERVGLSGTVVHLAKPAPNKPAQAGMLARPRG